MLIRDVALFLQAQSIGTFDEETATGDIFLSTLPSDPNDCISIYDTGGPERSVGLEMIDLRRTIQIIVRNVNLLDASQTSWSIFKLLKDYVELPNSRQAIFKALNPPTPIGQDSNRRFEFSTNYFLWTKED